MNSFCVSGPICYKCGAWVYGSAYTIENGCFLCDSCKSNQPLTLDTAKALSELVQ
jgi:hypothetical protein